MRIQNCDSGKCDFAQRLLRIGNGTWIHNEYEIEYNESVCRQCEDLNTLITSTFPDITSNYTNKSWLPERAIVTLRNEVVDTINETILQEIPGEIRCYKSIDTTVDENEATLYPTEFLNSLQHSGIPQHELKLKVGAPIILMRNLCPPKLCNGTKLIIQKLNKYTIEAEIITGQGYCLKLRFVQSTLIFFYF